MDPKNLINGQKPEIGNLEHIAFYKNQVAIMSGETPVSQIEWRPCHYWGATTETRKPKFRYCDEERADAMVDHILCPRCQRLHVILIAFDPQELFYGELLRVDHAAGTFECWNCKLEFETDEDRYVYVKQTK